MLDLAVRRRIDPILDRVGDALAARGVSANGVTIAAFAVGIAAAGAIAAGFMWLGLTLVLVSRIGDGLDGSVARAQARHSGGARFGTVLGGYLDIVLDFGFYALVPLAFVVHDPAANGVAGAVLLAAFYFNGASFLAFAAADREHDAQPTGSKAFLYTVGLMEGTETIVFFCALCVFPDWFAPLAYAFAALTLVTTAARIALAVQTFR